MCESPAETGLYYLQSRYYAPEIGRFINADDASYLWTNGDLFIYNLFTYCMNDPVNMIDLFGLWPQWIENIENGLSDFFEHVSETVDSFFDSVSMFKEHQKKDQKIRQIGTSMRKGRHVKTEIMVMKKEIAEEKTDQTNAIIIFVSAKTLNQG